MTKKFTIEDAREFIKKMNLDMGKEKFTENDILRGLHVELEHGTISAETNITNDDLVMTGKIALAHLREMHDYYDRLEKIESTESISQMKGGNKIKVYRLNLLK